MLTLLKNIKLLVLSKYLYKPMQKAVLLSTTRNVSKFVDTTAFDKNHGSDNLESATTAQSKIMISCSIWSDKRPLKILPPMLPREQPFFIIASVTILHMEFCRHPVPKYYYFAYENKAKRIIIMSKKK